MNIQEAVNVASEAIQYVTDAPRLEADLLLAYTLNVTRSYLYTRPELALMDEQASQFLTFVDRRKQGEPLAYICGFKEFWSRSFKVNSDVLIPRPESELIIETALGEIVNPFARIADLGVGSGILGITLALERPHWEIHGVEFCEKALTIAKENQTLHKANNISFHLGSWCEALPPLSFDAILSNPPYIAAQDNALDKYVREYEPALALIAKKDGLDALETIILQARTYLKPNGLLILEHGFKQAKKVALILEEACYSRIKIARDLAGLERVTIATWQGYDIK